MNGAHALIQTLVDSQVDVCFANPGTSEMHFVAAVDDTPAMRVVLTLFEGVATGAADGYARIAGKPAATLLHLGPGMANGMANLHNARRAKSPIVNIVGDHATYHGQYDSPLNSDIATVARTFSGRVERPHRSDLLGDAVAEAVRSALAPPGSISTLILPADVSWSEGGVPAPSREKAGRREVDPAVVEAVGALLKAGERCTFLVGGSAATADGLEQLAKIASASGAEVLLETSIARLERAGGLPTFARLNYRSGAAVRQLAGTRHLILVDAKSPVAFFAYPDKPSDLVPAGCAVHQLSAGDEDSHRALAALAHAVAPGAAAERAPIVRPDRPCGPLNAATAADAIAALLPEDAIVIDEGVTSGGSVAAATANGPRHDWLNVTGGAIGIGLPMAIGAAVAAPHRKVVGLQADGSSLYTIQALWTMARENLDATTILFNNRSYSILRSELKRVGATEGPKAHDMLDLSRPDIDFVSISTGLGVEAERATTAEEFYEALDRALSADGPRLVEAML